MNKIETIRIPADEMQSTFNAILLTLGFNKDKALQCATIFTSNSVDGVYTHGVNRFPIFVQYVKEGLVNKDAEPLPEAAFNGIEQWDGQLGPGVLNAVVATDRAVLLANQNGIGCVALRNTNHWMRGGYYGWQAAKKDCVFIGWSNTIANMPAWGAVDARLGNNPLVIAVPYSEEAIVMDMAMSQFSFGAMELAQGKGEKLSVPGGYDSNGHLTDDPGAILETKRTLPVGYWKGAGLSLLLDILGAILSGGLATNQVTALGKERSLSQVFVCINLSKLKNYKSIESCIRSIIDDYKASIKEGDKEIIYPGESVVKKRAQNIAKGIPVLANVWNEIRALM